MEWPCLSLKKYQNGTTQADLINVIEGTGIQTRMMHVPKEVNQVANNFMRLHQSSKYPDIKEFPLARKWRKPLKDNFLAYD
jgi:hypothetical protein